MVRSEEHLRELRQDSESGPVLLFKYSPRCSLSASVRMRLESGWATLRDVFSDIYLVDVVFDRPLSQAIAAEYGVQHESPQALIIHHGRCVYHRSHMAVRPDDLSDQGSAVHLGPADQKKMM